MSDITILSSEPVMSANPLGVILTFIGIGIMFSSIILLFIINKSTIPMIVVSIGACLSLGGLGLTCIDQVEDYVQYSVLISDDANFKEIYEKYEILEVKGEIYEIKEIEK